MRSPAIVALIVLSGCFAPATTFDATAPEATGLPTQWAMTAESCWTVAAFFLVEPTQALPYLPPGFHPGDLSDFLYNTPVTSGKVPAFAAASICDRFNATNLDSGVLREGAMEVVYIGFFIRPPGFVSAYANQPSDFNFYAVSFLTPLANGTAATQVPSDAVSMYGWDQREAHVTLRVDNMTEAAPSGHPMLRELTRNRTAPDHADILQGLGAVEMDGEAVFTFEASAFFPQPFEQPPRLRFWHAGPAGIGFMEFLLPQKTVMAGPLEDCWMKKDSIIHDVAGDRVGTNEGKPCGTTESFALVFDEHRLTGLLHHMNGVNAR